MTQPPAPVPLSREDRAILDVECDTIVGHTCKVVVLGGPAPPLENLRARVQAGVAAAPALRSRLGGPDGEPVWVPCANFDVAEHVRVNDPGAPPMPAGALPAEVAHLFSQRLERSRPLWSIDVVPLEEDGTALVWRIHHALADGTASMRFAEAILWDPEPGLTLHHAAARSAAAADGKRRRRHLLAFVDHELGESIHHSPFDGTIGRERRVAFASVPLEPLHHAAKAIDGATLNDAVLAVASGALRRWVETHHGSLKGVRARVPVSLHHDGDAAGNRDSFFTIALPLSEPDPVARLQRVHAATRDRKMDHDAESMDSMLGALAGVSPELEHLFKKIESSPRRFALSVSNVPGPRRPVSILEAPVRSVHSLAEIGSRHALRVAVVSFAGALNFGFCADPHLVPDLEAMARGVEAEAGLLVEAAA